MGPVLQGGASLHFYRFPLFSCGFILLRSWCGGAQSQGPAPPAFVSIDFKCFFPGFDGVSRLAWRGPVPTTPASTTGFSWISFGFHSIARLARRGRVPGLRHVGINLLLDFDDFPKFFMRRSQEHHRKHIGNSMAIVWSCLW